jgi:hypothetical protein
MSLLLLALPTFASGARAPLPPGPVNAELIAKATNGYSAQLKTEGDRIRLGLARGLFPELVYTFRGRVSAAGIQAKIADLGTIDLRFNASGKTRHANPPRNCTGPRATQVAGHFVGEFDFRAERGVTKLHLTRAEGSLASPGWRCAREHLSDFLRRAPVGTTYTFLQASELGRPGGFTAFAGVDAEHPEPLGAEISAADRTHRGPVTVDHFAIALAKNVFSLDSGLTTATVTPPRPFRGSATYCRGCEGGSLWTGDLSVVLPGIGRPVALTGSSYRATLKSLVGGGDSE